MTRNQLIDYVERRYGLQHGDSIKVVDQYLNHGFTWLDIVRRLDFDSKINKYSRLMQFA